MSTSLIIFSHDRSSIFTVHNIQKTMPSLYVVYRKKNAEDRKVDVHQMSMKANDRREKIHRMERCRMKVKKNKIMTTVIEKSHGR